MKTPTPAVTHLLIAAILFVFAHSLYAETCQEKHDACVAACNRKGTLKAQAVCRQNCDDQLKQCEDRNRPPTLDLNKGTDLDVCLDGGPPCRGSVPKICTLMAGSCDNCWKTLCGGTWFFGSTVPMDVKLLAATDGAKTGRVLATSSMKGKQAALRVPTNIKLNNKEQLYFEFSSKKKPGGSVKVHIHREK